MKSSFEINNTTNTIIDELDDLKLFLTFALEHEQLDNVIFNVIITDEMTIKKLNSEYRKIDKVTDVISFALEDYNDIVYNDFRLLGDIYICLEKTKSQALEYEHSFKRELCFLALHGLLHLLGYDHMNETDEKVMFALQEVILNDYGITR